ncbi:hypothetical protein EZS27_031879 [termite gut metagenome]|uniref:Uncharacterized protein n=1 Tax=termite gut metagenome TaxID=433724 RepID=A0A5J4QBV9_9ZZZZ
MVTDFVVVKLYVTTFHLFLFDEAYIGGKPGKENNHDDNNKENNNNKRGRGTNKTQQIQVTNATFSSKMHKRF